MCEVRTFTPMEAAKSIIRFVFATSSLRWSGLMKPRPKSPQSADIPIPKVFSFSRSHRFSSSVVKSGSSSPTG